MEFLINGKVFDSDKAELLFDSGRYADGDSDGYLCDSQEKYYATNNGNFFKIIFSWQNTSLFRRKLLKDPEICCCARDINDICYIMNSFADEKTKQKFKDKYLKEA